MNLKDELTNIKGYIDQTFENQFLKFDNKLTTLCGLQYFEKCLEGSSLGSSSDHLRASLMKLKKAASKAPGMVETTSTIPEVPTKEVEAAKEATNHK